MFNYEVQRNEIIREEMATMNGRFVTDVIEDIQEYISKKYGAPSIFHVFRQDGRMFPYFPKKRYQYFCSFCEKFRRYTGTPGEFSKCVNEDQKSIRKQIRKNGKNQESCWKTCVMGLQNLSVPVRSLKSGEIAATFLFGQYLSEDPESVRLIKKKILELSDTPEIFEPYCSMNNLNTDHIINDLKSEVDRIPHISNLKKEEYEQDIRFIINVLENIAVGAIQKGSIFNRERLVDRLKLNGANEHLDEEGIAKKLAFACSRIVKYLDFDTYSIYKSSPERYTEMKRLHSYGVNNALGKSIGFPTYECFKFFKQKQGALLPSIKKNAIWIDPNIYFGAVKAIAFSIETIGGEMFYIGFGYNRKMPPSPLQFDTLRYAVRRAMQNFLENSYFAVTLDQLTRETGHMLGRASAKIEVSLTAFYELLEKHKIDPEDQEHYDHHKNTSEDGVWNLRLIQHNYHTFKESRLGLEYKIINAHEEYDLVRAFMNMLPMFERMADNNKKSIELKTFGDNKYFIRGDQEKMQLVFLNLIDNAIKYSYRDTFINVVMHVSEAEIIFSFENLGTGVAPDEQERVFKPFVQSRLRSHISDPAGIGLGLSFCKRIVEKHYLGNITLTSKKLHSKKRRPENENWLTRLTINIPNRQKSISTDDMKAKHN